MDRFTHLALAAARQAEADAGIDIAAEADRVGAAVATGIGGLKSFETCIQMLDERGPDRVNPFSIVQIIPNLAAGWVSMELGTKGPLLSECTACAASNMAIGDGLDAIRLGRADVMICGGTEAPVSRVGIAGLRRDARDLAAQRRPEARVAAVRRRARRVRHGRGGGDGRPRGARARPGARREDLRRAARLRRLLRRDPRLRPRPDRREPRARDADGVRRRRHRAGRGRLRQRARHVDAGRRQRPRRACIKLALGEEKAYADAGLVDEGRDGSLPRRGGRRRGDLHDPRARSAACSRRRSTRRSPTRSATSTTSRTRRASSRSRSASRTRSASAATTPASSSAAGTAEPAV